VERLAQGWLWCTEAFVIPIAARGLRPSTHIRRWARAAPSHRIAALMGDNAAQPDVPALGSAWCYPSIGALVERFKLASTEPHRERRVAPPSRWRPRAAPLEQAGDWPATQSARHFASTTSGPAGLPPNNRRSAGPLARARDANSLVSTRGRPNSSTPDPPGHLV